MKPIPHIFISEEIVKLIKHESAQKKQLETGGLLLGNIAQNETGRSIFITVASGPGKNAVHQRDSFRPDINYYCDFITEHREEKYIGEWHTHPKGYDSWSATDLQQAHKILREERREEMICLLYLPDSQEKLLFYYLSQTLDVFLPLSFTVVPSQKKQPPITHVYVDKKQLHRFFRSKEQAQMQLLDLYSKDKVAHVFSQHLLGNGKALLLRQQSMTADIPEDVDIVIVVAKKNHRFKVRCYQMRGGYPIEVKTTVICLQKGIVSRNHSLQETIVLKNCHVAIIGVGSIGSVCAAELARAGIGEITLVDYDLVSVNNICRHLCDISEIGIAKVTAVERRLQKISPATKVNTHNININDNPNKLTAICKNVDAILVATDTENSRKLANWVAIETKIPIIFAGVLERAVGGRVWRVIPEKTCCYQCHSQAMEITHRNTVAYSQATSIRELKVQPGLGNDIAFISHIAVRYIFETLKEKIEPDHSNLLCNMIFWFNHPHEKWKNKGLSIYHLDDLPVNKNCPICQSGGNTDV